MKAPLTLLYLAHLNWDHVWQRPQQLMSRFAARCRVIYVDPPQLVDGAKETRLQERPGATGVRVVRPLFPAEQIDPPGVNQPPDDLLPTKPGEGNSFQRLWLELLPDLLEQAGPNTIIWVSSPMVDYLVAAARRDTRLAVYDCMDDLASFRDGTQTMRRREDRLLKLVDLVFTGGHSMYEARKDRHPQVYCFPSGVDTDHYRQVQDPSTRVLATVARIPQPRLGYFGVLDERIDWELIRCMAECRPQWHWLLVGPTAKVQRQELPVAPNIHYLGQQPYEQLPAFLKSFHIATMPFALNEATRYISPTKTLEYLAGGKPVISSSVPDVAAFYRDIVYLADGPDAWIEAVEQVLAASPAELQARLDQAAPMLYDNSWDGITRRMWTLIAERL